MFRTSLTSLVLIACMSTLATPHPTTHAQAASNETKSTRPGYTGDQACLNCHTEQSANYHRTSHYLSAQLPTKDSILGSFRDPHNTLKLQPASFAPALTFKMEQRPTGFYETAILGAAGFTTKRTERIDLVIGSGARGQTYLYWSGNKLYELPISYWSEGRQWINSPGYQDGAADFGRPVDARCIECHATYIRPLSADPQANVFDPSTLVAGISCETCHGPGADHVALEKANAPAPNPAILNPAKFPRDRQIDQCALCHDGAQSQQLKPAFTYLPGQPLDDYLTVDPTTITNQPDVHGNQVGLLKKSRCYLSSSTMSCSTCHNVHQPERTAADYSSRCFTCHTWQSCGASHTLGSSITHNCIDCHMPLQQTNAIVSVTAGRILRTTIRTHWIKVYPQK